MIPHNEANKKAYEAGLTDAKKEQDGKVIRKNEMNQAYTAGANDERSVNEQAMMEAQIMNQQMMDNQAGLGGSMSQQGNPPNRPENEPAQYGSQEASNNKQIAEIVATEATKIALENGIQSGDQEAMRNVIGPLLAEIVGPDVGPDDRDAIEEIGVLAMGIASQDLEQKEKLGGSMGAGIGQNPQAPEQAQAQQMAMQEPPPTANPPAGLNV